MLNKSRKLIFLVIFDRMFNRESRFEVEFVQYVLTSGNKNFPVI